MQFNLLKRIANHFDLKEEETIRLIHSSPLRYKVYPIPKRKEGEYRIIAQPAKEVKILQYWVMDNVLKDLPIHQSALAYIPKRNIRHNAIIHANSKFLLKMDFEKFFPSIKPRDFRIYMQTRENKLISDEDINYAIYILFWKPKGSNDYELSIGAPSSPLLSNILMLEFDNRVDIMCKELNVNYSRYADDLTFSTDTPQVLKIIYNNIKNICKELKYPSLKINENKTFYASKKHRRRVTGLILTNDNQVSLGREKKRAIRAKIYLFTKGLLSKKDSIYLKGFLAFAMDVEPNFVQRMRKKYGEKIIQSILKLS